MRDLTLRQVEVIRAVMMTGTIQGAAEFLNVSAPGISRLRQAHRGKPRRPALRAQGRPLRPGRRGGAGLRADPPDPREDGRPLLRARPAEARRRVRARLRRRCRRSPSSSPPAPSMQVRRRFPELYIDLNVLKIEETVDYLLLERGEFVASSYRFDHPSLEFRQIGTGELVVILPEDHRLAGAPRALGPRHRRRAADRRRRRRPLRRDHRAPLRRRRPAASPLGQGALRPDRGQPRPPRPRRRDHRRVLGRRRLHARPRARPARRPGADLASTSPRRPAAVLSSYADYAIDRLRDELRRAVAARPWAQRD